MAQPNIQLSQCMIVKNEEKNIERALSWGKDIVCEQIVVDTGSTDRTVELAKKMGAKVFHFTWINDFSAAKNCAIEQAKGNWIAFLDADEFFSEEEAKKLMDFLVRIHDNPQIAFIRTKITHINQDGTVLAVSSQDRIFRNHPDIRYRYRIHEQVDNYGKSKLKCLDAQDDLMILHTGYGLQVNRPEKGMRNIQLLQAELKEHPEDGMLLMYLGDSYDMAGRTPEALECYRKVLWDPTVNTSNSVSVLRAGLQILRIRANEPVSSVEEELFKISKKLQDSGHGLHPDLDYLKGRWYLRSNQIDQAATLFESALRKLEWYQDEEIANMTADLVMPNQVIAAAALQKGDLQKAVQFAVPALRIDRYAQSAIKVLLSAFHAEWQEGSSVEPYWNFLVKLYDSENTKDLLTLYKVAKEVEFYELAERVQQSFPKEIKERLSE